MSAVDWEREAVYHPQHVQECGIRAACETAVMKREGETACEINVLERAGKAACEIDVMERERIAACAKTAANLNDAVAEGACDAEVVTEGRGGRGRRGGGGAGGSG